MVDERSHKIASDLLPEMFRGAVGAGMALLSITTLNYVIAALTILYLSLMIYRQLRENGFFTWVKRTFGRKPEE